MGMCFWKEWRKQFCTRNVPVESIVEDKEKLIAMLIDRKLKFSNSSDESLKSTFSEFLDTMGKKINKLEERIKELENSIKQKRSESSQSNLKANSLENPDCPISSFEGYSACPGKIQWMKERWTSDKCYGEWGVDGSECSIVKYLSEVESWCPKLASFQKSNSNKKNNTIKVPIVLQTNFDELFKKIDGDKHFEWIGMRIRRMEEKWSNASLKLAGKPYIKKFQKKSILVHLGLLAEETGWNIAKNAFSGGPLGELVQWSDLIASLHVLGHDITLTVSTLDLRKQQSEKPELQPELLLTKRQKSINLSFLPNLHLEDLKAFENAELHLQSYLDSIPSINCPVQGTLYDIIYTDIGGLKMLKKVMGLKFHILQCSMRVVDSFGTEPEYNFPSYADRKKMKSEWGKWNFFPKQFNTMFPHTPDNTFLGFVIETMDRFNSSVRRQNRAVVYGKRDVFWKDKTPFLDAIHSLVEIHGTVTNEEPHQYLPPYVVNHGLLPGKELHELLLSAKIFVGLGFPYEGPAPLEAIADGAVFLNPIFRKGSALYNDAAKFFTKKPTNRKLTSQHPYAENFIGSPHVRMVDLSNADEVKNVVKEIIEQLPTWENNATNHWVGALLFYTITTFLFYTHFKTAAKKVQGYMPYEFTCFGMLERVAFLVEKQEFCSQEKSWPPLSSLKTIEQCKARITALALPDRTSISSFCFPSQVPPQDTCTSPHASMVLRQLAKNIGQDFSTKIVVSDNTKSCAEACLQQGALCEPHFFPEINQRSTFKMLDITCENFESPRANMEEIDYPSYKDKTCFIQGNPKLFSCAGRYTNTNRICPCRDYVKGQVSMCKDCFV